MGKRSRAKRERTTAQPPAAAEHSALSTQHSALAWILAAAIALVTLAIYAQVRTHAFVNYDDPDYVVRNTHVNSGLSLANVKWAFTSVHSSNWHPLTWISHMTDVQLFGLDAGKHLLVNVVLHVLNAILLLFVLRRLTGSTWRSAAVAALFALHPLHVESVAWLSERKDVLSTLFFLLAILAYAGGRRWWTFVAFALGIMAKPSVITLPFVLLLIDWWPLRRWSLREIGKLKSLVIEKWALFLLIPFSAAMTMRAQETAMAPVALRYRLANAVIAYVEYLGKALVPTKLAFLYPYPAVISPSAAIFSLLFLIAVTIVVLRLSDRFAYLPVGWLWYLGTLVPMIGLVQVGHQRMADRYTYIPLIGIFIAVVWLASELVRVGVFRYALAAIALVAFASLTYAQAGVWRDSTTLFTHALDIDPRNDVAHNGLGSLAAQTGDTAAARREYEAAMAASPRNPEAYRNLARLELASGHPDRAIQVLQQLMAIHPDDIAMGELASARGDVDGAIAAYRRALAENPDAYELHNDFGALLARKGDDAGAMREYETSLRLEHDNYDAHMNAGALLARTGHEAEALQHFRDAAAMRPKTPEPHIYLALMYGNANRFGEAVKEARAAQEIDAALANEQFTNAVHIEPRPTNLSDYLGALERKAAGRG